VGDVPPERQHDAGACPRDAGHALSLRRVIAAIAAALLVAGLLALGTWQLQRRVWKLALIQRVEQRVHAPADAAPAPDQWPQVNRAADEYRHVRITGSFLNDRETLVQAVTDLGSGFWVLTPLRLADGRTVLVNRGFVPPQARARAARGTPEPTGEITVTGLRRKPPPGSVMRTNDPAADRWYSRDVQAIAAARGLGAVAPFFIDADAVPGQQLDSQGQNAQQTWPAGGLTVIRFPNNHLVYAITWYALALMAAAAAASVAREERRKRRRQIGENGP
jgi:surfeit locus 1 family protein